MLHPTSEASPNGTTQPGLITASSARGFLAAAKQGHPPLHGEDCGALDWLLLALLPLPSSKPNGTLPPPAICSSCHACRGQLHSHCSTFSQICSRPAPRHGADAHGWTSETAQRVLKAHPHALLILYSTVACGDVLVDHINSAVLTPLNKNSSGDSVRPIATPGIWHKLAASNGCSVMALEAQAVVRGRGKDLAVGFALTSTLPSMTSTDLLP